jgi:hypothetical protein
MIKKIINNCDLTNKLIFAVLITVIVFILTYINNYFFYNYVKIRDYQEIRTLAKTIHFLMQKCDNQQNCLSTVSSYLDKSDLFVEVSISNNDNRKIIEYFNIKKGIYKGKK